MGSAYREEPLYKNKALWGVVSIFVVLGALGYIQSQTTWFLGAAPADAAVTDLRAQRIPAVANKLEMKKRFDLKGGVRVLFSNSEMQADFEKISSHYAECLSSSTCVISGNLWSLYQSLQSKTNELGEEGVKYYTVNLLNHMLKKMEIVKSARDSYRESARKIIIDMNKDSFAVTPSWIILADLAYQSGDVKEAKNLYMQTLEMSRQSKLEFEEQIDVETLLRVKNRCYELGCEVSASLDQGI